MEMRERRRIEQEVETSKKPPTKNKRNRGKQPPAHQRKKRTVVWISLFAAVLLLTVGGYSAGIGYFAEKFLPNTYINKIEVSGTTPEQASAYLQQEALKETITLEENGQVIGQIELSELNPEITSATIIEDYYQSQSPNTWLASHFNSTDFSLSIKDYIEVDSLAVQTALEKYIDNTERLEPVDARIDYSKSEGYHTIEEQAGTQINLQEVAQDIQADIGGGNQTVELSEYYQTPELTLEDERLVTVMDKINTTVNQDLTIEVMDQSVKVTKDQIEDWMYFDGRNQLVFDYDSIYEWLGTLNEEYATYRKPHIFESTLQGTVEVPGGTYGWSINREETTAVLQESLANQSGVAQAIIDGGGFAGIEDDYIEVDLTYQVMYVYIDGVLQLETDIVSGNTLTEPPSPTIPGTYAVWNKESPSVLRETNAQTGVAYEQPVTYWLPFDDTGQGIHDANWQSNFGGDVYLYYGSQGCINTPPGVMAQVYELAYVGIPVVVF